jgi:hypothetical protein
MSYCAWVLGRGADGRRRQLSTSYPVVQRAFVGTCLIVFIFSPCLFVFLFVSLHLLLPFYCYTMILTMYSDSSLPVGGCRGCAKITESEKQQFEETIISDDGEFGFSSVFTSPKVPFFLPIVLSLCLDRV